MITKYIEDLSGQDEKQQATTDDKSGVKAKIKGSLADIAVATARNMYASVPVILESEDLFAIETEECNGFVVRITSDAAALSLLLLKTGILGGFESILTRFKLLAESEEMDFDLGYGGGEQFYFEIKITKKKDVVYSKPMDLETITFIQMFDYDLI